eukprot:1152053-Pelagomonas_calceolata.AAC.1
MLILKAGGVKRMVALGATAAMIERGLLEGQAAQQLLQQALLEGHQPHQQLHPLAAHHLPCSKIIRMKEAAAGGHNV